MITRGAAGFAVLLMLTGAAAAQPAPAAPVGRAYTSLDLDKCRHRRGRDAEDYGSWRCTGYRGIAVLVTAGDQRVNVSYGRNAANEPAASQTLAAFNSAGRRIEWRLVRENGRPRPFAAILRWNTTVPADNGDPVRGAVLVITRLGPGGVCHVGYVDARANTDANALAVQIADEHARGFRCGTDKPVVRGVRGPGFSVPYGAAD
jgi:hypothetical protein